jgi:anaerobic selenocysteine-containing dehydrogenase
MERIVRTVCQGCHCECGVLAKVKDGTVVEVNGDPEHPMNKGFVCVKGRAQPEVTHHPDRLKYPLRRVGGRGEGKWERVSWDEALHAIATKLTEIKEKYGSESIAAIHGTGPRASLNSTLLPFALNDPNRISVDLHICYAPSLVAEGVTVGHSITMEEGPDYQNANCILVWGGNPLISHPPRGMEIIEAKRKRKVKLIVIDPRQTYLASQADWWLQIRPGTDVALALGMLNVIIDKGLYDKEFVDKWCYGFDKLREHVKEFTPEKVSEITWIPADKIREASETYATTKPATLHHRVAIEQNVNSTQTDRALIILVALTGNIDVKGGNLLPTHIEGYIPSIALSGAGRWLRPSREIEEKRIGSKEFPLISGPEARLPFVTSFFAVDAMLTGKPYPIKALYCAGANPVINVQNSKKVWDALKRLELLLVIDFFMTPTAELADYVLPATTWLEREECCDIPYMNYISARQKAIEPLYECWDDLKIVIELVKRIPWANKKLLSWNDVNECYNWMVRGMGLTFDEFKRKGYIVTPIKYKKYEEKGFDTPSGKVELYSTIFHKFGYNPLPIFKEPPESPVSTPELMKDYPLILITGGRCMEYFHSEGRQITQLRKIVPDPEVEIHPDTAKEANIKDGEWIWIETPQVKGERIKFKVKLTPQIHPRIVHAPHGWWFPEKPGPEHGCFDSNINVIMSADPPREEICGSVPTRGTLCKIYK